MSISNNLTVTIEGIIGAVLGFIITFLIVGNTSTVTQINNALTAICNSGWPLAGLFSTSGVMPLIFMAGLIVAGTSLGFGIGGAVKKGRK